MSEFLNHNENYILNLYRQASESFSRLEFEMLHETNKSMRKVGLRFAQASLEQLIKVEMENTFPACEFDAKNILYCLRDHLLLLEKVHPVDLRIESPQKSNCTTKIEQEKQSLKEIVAKMQVNPRVKGLQDIAGLADVKKILTTIVILPIYQPQLYEGRKICNSVLLYGPPGTGKTLLAHALAAEISAHLFSVTSSDILLPYVGQTEKMVQALFEFIKEPRKGPTILFIDEIDGLCRSRNANESEWGRRLKTELMCQLSNFEDVQNVFLICATNCPWDLDSAFLRRFQRRVYIPLPASFDRHELLQLLVKDSGISISSTSWGPLLSRTEGYSGSDLSDLVRNATNIPITELLDTEIWKPIGDKYQPVTENEYFNQSTINCDFRKLPAESIKARDPHIGDLIAALDIVRPTVSDTNIREFEKFMKNA